jgi:hypothetical protein
MHQTKRRKLRTRSLTSGPLLTGNAPINAGIHALAAAWVAVFQSTSAGLQGARSLSARLQFSH